MTMFKNFTIRRGLTVTIAGYTVALLIVLLAAVAGLRQSNQALEQMYSTDTVALTHLKTSSERLLQVRLALGNFETLFTLGKASDDLLPSARKTLAVLNSMRTFRSHAMQRKTGWHRRSRLRGLR